MKTLLIVSIIILLLCPSNANAKIIDIDTNLKRYYLNGDYDNCIKLSRIILTGKLLEYRLPKFGIKWNKNNTYSSDSAYYWEYLSLMNTDKGAFFYRYVINQDEFLKYFCNEDLIGFNTWVYEEFNSEIPKYVGYDDYAIIGNEMYKRFKLAEIYNFLDKEDTLLRNEVFESEIIKAEFRNKIKALSIKSIHDENVAFIPIIINELINKHRLVTPQQINSVLLEGFTKPEIIAIVYSLVSTSIHYDGLSGHSDPSNVNNIIKYNATICNGYANLMNHFLSINDIECYKIILGTTRSQWGLSGHANNIIVFNNDVFYVDATWGVYYTSFKSKIKIRGVEKSIPDFSYIEYIENADTYKTIDRFNEILKRPKKIGIALKY